MRPALLAFLLALCFVGVALPDKDKLTQVQVARMGKAATALVECDIPGGKSHGSAFCIQASGLFVTNEHVVRDSTAVRLVLNPSLKAQKVVKAKVVRRDKENDFALPRAEDVKDLPDLKIGDSDKLEELQEVIACGFPFGRALTVSKDDYPAVSINKGGVTALRRKGTALYRIQVDVSLNPGNFGGALLDLEGKVLGVVVSGLRGTAVNFVIPSNLLAKFLDKPDIDLTLPTIKADTRHNEFEFTAKATSILPATKPLGLDLVIGLSGKERRFPMTLTKGVYRVKAIPFPAPKGKRLFCVQVKFDDGLVSGSTENKTFQLGNTKVKFSELKTLRLGTKTEATLNDGKTLSGKHADLDALAVTVGNQSLNLGLASATELSITAEEDVTAATCTVVVTQGDKELDRIETPLYFDGVGKFGIDALVEGRFVRPPRSSGKTSYLKAVSSKGDYIGQGKTYSYGGDVLTARVTPRGVSISVGGQDGGWRIEFSGPGNKSLEVGEYNDAKRAAFRGESPGLDFFGQGRGSNRLSGKFVVWEIEVKGNVVVKLAIDFVQRSEEQGPPLYGSLRINSSFH